MVYVTNWRWRTLVPIVDGAYQIKCDAMAQITEGALRTKY
jgi:hypothetical protein